MVRYNEEWFLYCEAIEPVINFSHDNVMGESQGLHIGTRDALLEFCDGDIETAIDRDLIENEGGDPDALYRNIKQEVIEA